MNQEGLPEGEGKAEVEGVVEVEWNIIIMGMVVVEMIDTGACLLRVMVLETGSAIRIIEETIEEEMIEGIIGAEGIARIGTVEIMIGDTEVGLLHGRGDDVDCSSLLYHGMGLHESQVYMDWRKYQIFTYSQFLSCL